MLTVFLVGRDRGIELQGEQADALGRWLDAASFKLPPDAADR